MSHALAVMPHWRRRGEDARDTCLQGPRFEIIKTKCTKRGVSLKAFDYGAVEPALSGTVRQTAKIQSGLTSEKAKEITKAIKDSKLKVQGQIQGEQVRVLSKSKDDLQATMTFLKGKDFGVDLQFTNYR